MNELPIGFRYESILIDRKDNLVSTAYIDVRDQDARTPIPRLVKGGEERHAPHLRGTIRISAIEKFRKTGRGLIFDPYEARGMRSEEHTETVEHIPRHQDSPLHIPEAGIYLPTSKGWEMKINSHTTTSSSRDEWSVSVKGVLIFSTSVEPEGGAEWERWWASLDEDYDSVYTILDPKRFARALASMVAEQLGPLSGKGEFTHTVDDFPSWTEHLPSLQLLHGPVVYVEDLYSEFTSLTSSSEALGKLLFYKQSRALGDAEMSDHQEYRFVVMVKDPLDSEYYDLDISAEMFETITDSTLCT